MRGKRIRVLGHNQDLGLIPAHAGKTRCRDRSPLISRAHPRACGENKGMVCKCRLSSGSSPRMRGKLGLTQAPLADGGLIPAHAGKTVHSKNSLAQDGAHPRACGENSLKCCRGCERQGSSPRMRGKQRRVFSGGHSRGLIPAHAGKTRSLADPGGA